MTAWPDFTEYHESVQYPARSFGDVILKETVIEKDRFGMPKPSTGANAVVYRATQKTGEMWAVRCFLRPITDHAYRYNAISTYLQQARLGYSCHFDFLPMGVRVKGHWFPVVKMAWVGGELLHRFIEANLRAPSCLASLRGKWIKMVHNLESSKIAHGDLQQGNILVRQNDFLLVDYDGMWVPSLTAHKGTEIGHRAFQHPMRTQDDYGPTVDRFSSLIIYLSLTALERQPELWEKYHNGDNLIFTPEDFKDLGTPIWRSLAEIRSAQVDHLSGALKEALLKPPSAMESLEGILSRAPPPLPEWIKTSTT